MTVLENHRHGLEDGDYVEFKEVKGMSEVNGRQYRVKALNPQSVSLQDADSGEPADSTGFGVYTVGGGGVISEVKRPKKLAFVRDRRGFSANNSMCSSRWQLPFKSPPLSLPTG